jgi:hypothetical protein
MTLPSCSTVSVDRKSQTPLLSSSWLLHSPFQWWRTFGPHKFFEHQPDISAKGIVQQHAESNTKEIASRREMVWALWIIASAILEMCEGNIIWNPKVSPRERVDLSDGKNESNIKLQQHKQLLPGCSATCRAWCLSRRRTLAALDDDLALKKSAIDMDISRTNMPHNESN